MRKNITQSGKIVTAVLAATLAAGLLAGCNGERSKSTEKTKGTTEVSTEVTTEKTEAQTTEAVSTIPKVTAGQNNADRFINRYAPLWSPAPTDCPITTLVAFDKPPKNA